MPSLCLNPFLISLDLLTFSAASKTSQSIPGEDCPIFKMHNNTNSPIAEAKAASSVGKVPVGAFAVDVGAAVLFQCS